MSVIPTPTTLTDKPAPPEHGDNYITHGKGFLTEPARRAIRPEKQDTESPRMNGASITGGA
ncbi:MAG: hypothetical protein AAGL98_06310, partial [Planctomycetota bacterium]